MKFLFHKLSNIKDETIAKNIATGIAPQSAKTTVELFPAPMAPGIGEQMKVLSFDALVRPLYVIIQLCYHFQIIFPSLSVFIRRFSTSDCGTQYHGIIDELGFVNSSKGGVDIVFGRSPDVGHVP